MRKIVSLLGVLGLLAFVHGIFAQERFIDVRQEMADSLTSVKTAISNNDWGEAQNHFDKAKTIWMRDIKPMIIEEVKSDEQFREYFDRMDEVEKHINELAQLLTEKSDREIESKVNAIIWGISHHPRGFDVPKPRYSVWDWIFGLGIGIGFCIFATYFGLYLRKSYYRRYKRNKI